MSTPEQVIATLILPNEYLYQLNSVAELTSEHVVFLRRKFVSSSGWELEKLPLNDLANIQYTASLPVGRIVGGGLLVILIAGILYFLFSNWGSLEAGQKVPVGAMALAGIYGLKLLFGARQHKLVFQMKSGDELAWRSRSGEFDAMQIPIDRIKAFANQRNLLVEL